LAVLQKRRDHFLFKNEEIIFTLWERCLQRLTFGPTLPTPFEHEQILPRKTSNPTKSECVGEWECVGNSGGRGGGGGGGGFSSGSSSNRHVEAANHATASGDRGRGDAPPHQEQGYLDVVPAKEERDPKLLIARPGNGTPAAGATGTSPTGAARATAGAAVEAAEGATAPAGSTATGPATEQSESPAPFEAPDPKCRCSDGTLPDSFEAVDALQLDVDVPCFNHIKIVPKAAMALWCECYIEASNGLSDALGFDPTHDEGSHLIIHRAFMRYVLLPQFILRNSRKSPIKNTGIINMRCTAFHGRNYGASLN
jgi:hypothetical protein